MNRTNWTKLDELYKTGWTGQNWNNWTKPNKNQIKQDKRVTNWGAGINDLTVKIGKMDELYELDKIGRIGRTAQNRMNWTKLEQWDKIVIKIR